MAEGRNILRDGPTEILFLIIENFRERPPEFNGTTYKEDFHTGCGDYYTLMSMCLVSRRLRAVATSVLYNTINLKDWRDTLTYSASMVI